MAETFYGALGVAEVADTETIRRAYREQVKRHHPDVSDDPDAPERFKRLTTARDVLVDADERRRYDRLGHADYVETRAGLDAWTSGRGVAANERVRTVGTTARTRAGDPGYDRTAWLGEDSVGPRGQRRRGRRQQAHTAGGTATAAEWQHASEAYRRTDTGVAAGRRSPVGSLLNALRSVGAWLVVHLVFVGSATATSWLAFTQLTSRFGVSWPTLLLAVALIGMTVLASVLHVVSQLYA